MDINSSQVAQKLFENDSAAIHKIKTTLKLKEPTYVSMCILELNKGALYQCLYNYIKSKYGSKS